MRSWWIYTENADAHWDLCDFSSESLVKFPKTGQFELEFCLMWVNDSQGHVLAQRDLGWTQLFEEHHCSGLEFYFFTGVHIKWQRNLFILQTIRGYDKNSFRDWCYHHFSLELSASHMDVQEILYPQLLCMTFQCRPTTVVTSTS